ncbi:hypothetical protein GCM10010461_17290 [Microbacterium aurantiacum]
MAAELTLSAPVSPEMISTFNGAPSALASGWADGLVQAVSTKAAAAIGARNAAARRFEVPRLLMIHSFVVGLLLSGGYT